MSLLLIPVSFLTHEALEQEEFEGTEIVDKILTLLPTAFYDFLSYGGDFYPTPQKTMLKLFDWFEIWYT